MSGGLLGISEEEKNFIFKTRQKMVRKLGQFMMIIWRILKIMKRKMTKKFKKIIMTTLMRVIMRFVIR